MKHLHRQLSLTRAAPLLLLLALPGTSLAALELDAFPAASEKIQRQAVTQDYRLALGALKKVNSVWRAEAEQRLAGQLTTETWRLPDTHEADEGFAHYQAQLQAMGAKTLFSCASWGCGSSASWANLRFNVKQLYGLDRYQRYGAYSLLQDGAEYHVALYSVLRGNKRAYVHLEVLQSDASQADGWQGQWRTLGYISPQLVDGGLGLNEVPAALALLAEQAGGSVAVVGHDYSAGSLAQQKARSLALAEAVMAQLVAAGADAERLQAEGLGSLAPAGRGGTAMRVDLVPVPGREL